MAHAAHQNTALAIGALQFFEASHSSSMHIGSRCDERYDVDEVNFWLMLPVFGAQRPCRIEFVCQMRIKVVEYRK